MKRILCSALALVLALSLCACGESGGDTGPTYPAAFAGLETQIDAMRTTALSAPTRWASW